MENTDKPDTSTGQEVSCRALDAYFTELSQKGLPPQTLTAGIDYPLAHLRDKNKRIDWDSFCIFLENCSKVWNDDEFLTICERLIDSPWIRPFILISKFLLSVKDIYHFGARPGTGAVSQLFRVSDGVVIDLAPNHIITEFTMQPGYAANYHFALVGLGIQRVLPTLVGLPKATVTMEFLETGARYDIWLPKGGESFITKLRQFIVWPFTMRTAINELQEAHDGLQEQNFELAKEIVARTKAEKALEQANVTAETARRAAESANQTKSVFLANMSHELRTPLNAILGFSQLMAGSSDLSAKHQEYVTIINRSGEHLLTLINDILDISKIEAGRITRETQQVDLYSLLDTLENMFRLKADGKGLHFQFYREPIVPRFIKTDEVKLRQILINLLHNAIKFTAAGEVTLRIAANNQQQSSSRLRFEIEDTGQGIAPEELETLFEAFVQTSAGYSAHEGTGLGLAISRQFVRLLGGELTVTSELGRGTCFQFEIEAVEIEGEAVSRQPERPVTGLIAGQPQYRILIVDDKWDNRRLLTALLEPMGFILQEAANGQEALDVWQSWQPHLILLDIRMPVLDGLEAARRIKATPQGQQTIIIAISASSLTVDQRTAPLAAGCDDFISKPFQEQEIFEKVGQHLHVRYLYRDTGSIIDTPASVRAQNGNNLPANLNKMPADWLSDLQYAAATVDSELAYQLIAQIETEHPQMAETLTYLVDNFQFTQLNNSISAIPDNGDQ